MIEPEDTQSEEVYNIVRAAISGWAGNYLSPTVINGLATEIVEKLQAAELF